MDQSTLPVFAEQQDATTWLLSVWVQPGAKKTELMGIFDGKLKLRLNAPAVDNKANTALIKYLAKTLNIRQSKIILQSGSISRHKIIRLECDTSPDWSLLATPK